MKLLSTILIGLAWMSSATAEITQVKDERPIVTRSSVASDVTKTERKVTISSTDSIYVVQWDSRTEISRADQKVYVLVHGTPGSHQDWGTLPIRLAEEGHKVLAIDRPGHGKSTNFKIEPDLTGNVDALDSVLDLYSPYIHGKELIVVGHSYGGNVVLKMALNEVELPANYKRRISRYVVIGSPLLNYPGDSPIYKLANLPMGENIVWGFDNMGVYRSSFSSLIDSWFMDTELAADFKHSRLPEWTGPKNVPMLVTMTRELGTMDDDVRDLDIESSARKIPNLQLIVGLEDLPKMVEQNRRVALSPEINAGKNIWLHEVPNVGHFVHLEDMHRVLGILTSPYFK